MIMGNKPAHATLNIAAGEGVLRPPSDPPAFRADVAAIGRCAPFTERRHPDARG